MKRILLSVLFLLALMFPFDLASQIVNIEDRRSQRGDTVAWFGSVDLGFNFVQNGNAIITLKGGINLERLHLRHLFLSFSRFNLVRIENQDFINDGFQHFRYNYRLNKRITWEVFAQAQYNEKISLRLRSLLGTGPRFSLLPAASRQRMFLGTLYMYEYDEETEQKEEGEIVIYHRDHRLSTYLAFRFQLRENVVIASTSYYQPVLTDLEDLRLSSQTTLLLNITKKLKFTTTFSIVYDSRVPEEVLNTTYSWTNGVRWEF